MDCTTRPGGRGARSARAVLQTRLMPDGGLRSDRRQRIDFYMPVLAAYR